MRNNFLDSKLKYKISIIAICLTLISITVLFTYSFFQIIVSTDQKETINVNAGNMELVFSDGNNGFRAELNFGENATKTFSITNNGTEDTTARINWKDLTNTYLESSLTYSLTYIENEGDTPIEAVNNQNIPTSESPVTLELASINIPAGKTYTLTLTITLNYLESINQTSDLKASFRTEFNIEEKPKTATVTFNPNGGNTEVTNKEVILETKYGELPTPTKEGYDFIGWFTQATGGEEITSETLLKTLGNKTLYARWEKAILKQGKATDVLLSRMNDASITNYNSGEKGEMYTFSHPATEQTEALIDYRYIGNVPNNYIQFNNETWRIIGVFTVEGENGIKEQRVKIIRDASIGDFPWDMKSNGTRINEWPTSTLATMLNGNYINAGKSFTYTWYTKDGQSYSNTINGLNTTAKNQIATTKWFLGSSSTTGAEGYYRVERLTDTCVNLGNCPEETRSTNYMAKVGLMYPSDYLYTYAYTVSNTCFSAGMYCYANKEKIVSWLFNSAFQWALTPAKESNDACCIYNDGRTGSSYSNPTYVVRPSVYLRSDIEITSGDGTSGNPYILK